MVGRGTCRAQIQAVLKPAMHMPKLWETDVLLHLSQLTVYGPPLILLANKNC